MNKNKTRIHITVNSVRALRPSPPNKKHFDWDDEVRGFGAYRTSGGVVVFVYQYRMPHQPARRAKIGEFGDLTPAQARDIARTWAVERRQDRDPVEERKRKAREVEAAKNLKFRIYVDNYIQRRKTEGKPLTKQHERIVRDDIGGLMPEVRIDRMTTSDIDDFLERLQQRSKSARIWGLVYLKVILNDAKARGHIAVSPADSFKLPPRAERDRVLKTDEIQRFLEAAYDMDDGHGTVLEVLLRTMRRREEIAGMSWEEIDQDSWVWTIPAERMKSKREYVMDLPVQVRAILEQQQPDPRKRTGWVFTHDGKRSITIGTQSKDSIDAHIQRRMECAVAEGRSPRRMEHWTIHDLRTTAGTHCGDAPLSIREEIIELCLAHATPKNRKSKYQRGEKRALTKPAFIAWNDHLDQLMERSDAWPGGRDIPPMPYGEIKRRQLDLRRDWPSRPRPQRKAGEKKGTVDE